MDHDGELDIPEFLRSGSRCSSITHPVPGCPRCGQSHEAVEFTPFTRQGLSPYTHAGNCPETGEPILAIQTQTVTPCDHRE